MQIRYNGVKFLSQQSYYLSSIHYNSRDKIKIIQLKKSAIIKYANEHQVSLEAFYFSAIQFSFLFYFIDKIIFYLEILTTTHHHCRYT